MGSDELFKRRKEEKGKKTCKQLNLQNGWLFVKE
jgi:hypothetical protein